MDFRELASDAKNGPLVTGPVGRNISMKAYAMAMNWGLPAPGMEISPRAEGFQQALKSGQYWSLCAALDPTASTTVFIIYSIKALT